MSRQLVEHQHTAISRAIEQYKLDWRGLLWKRQESFDKALFQKEIWEANRLLFV